MAIEVVGWQIGCSGPNGRLVVGVGIGFKRLPKPGLVLFAVVKGNVLPIFINVCHPLSGAILPRSSHLILLFITLPLLHLPFLLTVAPVPILLPLVLLTALVARFGRFLSEVGLRVLGVQSQHQ